MSWAGAAAWSVLAEVTGESSDRLAEQVQVAVDVGLLEEADGALFSFRHTLVRQTLAERLSPARRAALHLAAARYLQARNAVDDLWVIAHHLTVAAGVHGQLRAEAQESWRTAARRAATMGAHGDAAAHLGEAVKLASEHDRPRLLVELGSSTLRAGSPTEALEHFAVAARSSGDPEVVARAALGYEDAYLAVGSERLQTADPSIELLQNALTAQPDQSPVAPSLAAALARASWYSGDGAAAASWLQRAEQIAEGTDDDVAMRIAFARRVLSGAPGDSVALAASCSVLIDAAARIERRDIVLDAMRQRVLALVELGALDDADEEIERFDRLVHRWGEVLYLPYGPLLRAMRMLQRGELATARRLNRRAVELSEQVDSLVLGQLALMQRYALARWSGATIRFADELALYAGPTGSGPTWYMAAALADAENGQPEPRPASPPSGTGPHRGGADPAQRVLAVLSEPRQSRRPSTGRRAARRHTAPGAGSLPGPHGWQRRAFRGPCQSCRRAGRGDSGPSGGSARTARRRTSPGRRARLPTVAR